MRSHSKVLSSRVRLITLPTNNKLGWEGLPETNPLSYLGERRNILESPDGFLDEVNISAHTRISFSLA